MIRTLLLGAAMAAALSAAPAYAQDVLGVDVGAALGAGVDVAVPGIADVDAGAGAGTRIDADGRRDRDGLSLQSNSRVGAGAMVDIDRNRNGIDDRDEGPNDRVDGRRAENGRGQVDADCQAAMQDGRSASAQCVVDVQ